MKRLLKISESCMRLSRGRSALYDDAKRGLMVPFVKVGARAVGIPEHELDAVISARIAGQSDEQIKELVQLLVAARVRLRGADSSECYSAALEPKSNRKSPPTSTTPWPNNTSIPKR